MLDDPPLLAPEAPELFDPEPEPIPFVPVAPLPPTTAPPATEAPVPFPASDDPVWLPELEPPPFDEAPLRFPPAAVGVDLEFPLLLPAVFP